MANAEPSPELKPGPPAAAIETLDPEALEFQSDARRIDLTPIPVRQRWTLYTIAAGMGAAVLWAGLAQVDRVVSAEGRLVPLQGVTQVQPISTSVIKSVLVREGQVVTAGQLLATLDPTFAQADVADLEGQERSLDAQLARIESELADRDFVVPADAASAEWQTQAMVTRDRRAEFRAKVGAQDEQIARAEAMLRTNRDQRQQVTAIMEITGEMVNMRAQLHDKQYGSKLQLLDAQQRYLQLQADQRRLDRQAEELRHQIEGARSDRNAYVGGWRRDLAESMAKIRDQRQRVREQLAKANRVNALVELRAPVDAVVLDIPRRIPGSVVKEAEPVLSLVPAGDKLEAEVLINARDIGRLRPSDRVRVKLEAFPFQRHGTLSGTLRTISEDTFQQDKDRARAEPVYKARIQLEPGEKLRDVPDDFRMIPGMLATAEIKTGTRSVLSYFLYPVVRALDEALREP